MKNKMFFDIVIIGDGLVGIALYTNTTVLTLIIRQFVLEAVNIIKPIKQTFLQVLR
tara:strand:+ start:325 stop:492 length:168 start_codon:yes stop_codon:yes gene_type:complete